MPEGEVGEVVVTTFKREAPLIRFATGDLSAMLPGSSPCGRTNGRLKGWMGRADQAAKVKGMFVHPAQIADVVARHRQIGKARMVIERAREIDTMTLHCEVEGEPEGLGDAIAESILAVCKLRGGTRLCAPGSLANDGLVIEDRRTFD